MGLKLVFECCRFVPDFHKWLEGKTQELKTQRSKQAHQVECMLNTSRILSLNIGITPIRWTGVRAPRV